MGCCCEKYPLCGCEKPFEIKRNPFGYPLNDDGSIDWERTSVEKQAVLDASEKTNIEMRIKKRHKPTNYTPPKKKRKR